MTSSEAPVVDGHMHIFRQGLPLARVRRYVPSYDATLDDCIGQLDAHDVAYGVLVQPSFLGTDNSFLLEALEREPDRFRGVAVVDSDVDETYLETLRARGVVGIRLNLQGVDPPDVGSRPWRALLSWIREHRWHVEVIRPDADMPDVVGPLLDAGVTVVLDHFGTPDPQSGSDDPRFRYVLEMASTGLLWVKLAAWYRLGAGTENMKRARELTAGLLDSLGPGRLVWGSDWPHTRCEHVTSYAGARETIGNLVDDPTVQRRILSASGMDLFHFPSADQEAR